MTVAEALTYIANTIRGITGKTDKMKLYDMPNEIEQGMRQVSEAGYDQGIKQGKQAEYDRFWDAFQQNGNRTDYRYAFTAQWTEEIFKPKYPIKPKGSTAYMFRYFPIADVKAHCEQYGIVIDTSGSTNLDSIFQNSAVEIFGDLDTRGISAVTGVLYQASTLRTIRLILKDDGSQTFDRCFTQASKLENLEIVGKIGSNFDLSPCTKLTRASIDSVILALSTNLTSVQTLTLSATAVNNAFTTEEWNTLVGLLSSMNWNLGTA